MRCKKPNNNNATIGVKFNGASRALGMIFSIKPRNGSVKSIINVTIGEYGLGLTQLINTLIIIINS